jgi:heme A synthase
VYKHGALAVHNFWLMAMIACNIFRAFYIRNLKPAVRHGKTMLHFARAVAAELYLDVADGRGMPP